MKSIQGRKVFKGGNYLRKYGVDNIQDVLLGDKLLEKLIILAIKHKEICTFYKSFV